MNTIVICLDTLRWDALGCYNPNWVETPCIDHYARTATRFDMAFCASFPTVPMRADCYTGEVGWPRYGWHWPGADQPKLPELLRATGYHTGLVLDTVALLGPGGFQTPYDEHYLIDKDVDDGVTEDDIVVPVPREHVRGDAGEYIGNRVSRSHYRHEDDWFVTRTMRRACQWLEDNARRDNWFLWVDSFEIHEDWMPPKYYVDHYAPGYTGPDYTFPNYGYTDIYSPEALRHLRDCYAAEVTLADRWDGHLLRKIEIMGLFENTCVILTSDHGMYIGEHNRCGKHTVTAGDPWPIYDEVGRIPLLVWTPFENAPRTVAALCQPADITPTVLDLAGVPAPKTAGKSWKPLLTGAADACHDRIYTSHHSGSGPGGGEPTRSLITVTSPAHTAVLGPRPHRPELYDRRKDPVQLNNIAAKEPALIEALRADLVAFMEEQGADAEYVNTYAKGQ